MNSQLTPNNTEEFYQKINQRASRQKQLFELLRKNDHQPSAFYTKQGISSTVLKQGEEKGWLSFEDVEAYRDPYQGKNLKRTTALTLNEEQQQAVNSVLTSENKAKNDVFY
ncbi:primosomal protein n [Tetragenococcus muriaticus 3MR10-3]|uniref:Primosomal protein n n=1 Tax=Tetragenococcus muriaticus 3MR10-3 TaxID=1302648 RepID=A0A091CA11_9ENTE|nr:primosomal protein n [Tetragenococcus muriaticus 3MR10-3]